MTTRIDYSASRIDEARARRVRAIFETILVHTKGRYARKPFLLTEWQWLEIIRPLFGTVVYDPEIDEWIRRFVVAWIELARKNGKSELLAGIALVLLDGDDEEGAEVYGAAKDKDQAGLIFRVAARMVELSPALSRRLRVYRTQKRIVNVRTDSFYQVIAADAEGNLGPDPHGIIFDEIIAQPSRELWDALKTGMGSASRRQPLMVAATTAGNDPSSFAATEHDYCVKVANDPSIDPTRFVFMRNTPKTRLDRKTKKHVPVDWRNEREWHFANPALKSGFLRIEVLRAEANEAEQNPATENRFRQFRLNQWVQQAERWISLTVWDEAGMDLQLELEKRLKGRECWAGLDLASTQDTVALVLDFPLDDHVSHAGLFRFWVPEDRLPKLDERTGGQASVWAREGFLKLTSGNVIDHDSIWAQIRADANEFRIWELGFDPWNKGNIEAEFEDAPFELVEIRQTFLELSGATKEWEKFVLRKRYRHAGNPVMRWQVDNIVVETDPNENVKISKKKSKEKVDGPAAGVMALKLSLLGRRGGEDRTLRVS
jgi:phage terminase large subunit-like protein